MYTDYVYIYNSQNNICFIQWQIKLSFLTKNRNSAETFCWVLIWNWFTYYQKPLYLVINSRTEWQRCSTYKIHTAFICRSLTKSHCHIVNVKIHCIFGAPKKLNKMTLLWQSCFHGDANTTKFTPLTAKNVKIRMRYVFPIIELIFECPRIFSIYSCSRKTPPFSPTLLLMTGWLHRHVR